MQTLPRDDLVRAYRPGIELRAAEDDGMPTLFGHFAVFNKWTEIDSLWEGNFLERIAPGAFKKTFRENRDAIKSLFQHGHDPVVGDKPLGPFRELKEDSVGAYYEVPLLDTTYNRDLVPGLEAGLYGASFRFRVMREELVEEPEPSAENPQALPERTIKEARVYEGGPVTFPAYPDASAGVRDVVVRSLTDEFLWGRLSADPERLAEFIEEHGKGGGIFVTPGDGNADSAPDVNENEDQDVVVDEVDDDEVSEQVAVVEEEEDLGHGAPPEEPDVQEPAEATPVLEDPEEAATDEHEDDDQAFGFWFVGVESEDEKPSLKLPPRGGFYLFTESGQTKRKHG